MEGGVEPGGGWQRGIGASWRINKADLFLVVLPQLRSTCRFASAKSERPVIDVPLSRLRWPARCSAAWQRRRLLPEGSSGVVSSVVGPTVILVESVLLLVRPSRCCLWTKQSGRSSRHPLVPLMFLWSQKVVVPLLLCMSSYRCAGSRGLA